MSHQLPDFFNLGLISQSVVVVVTEQVEQVRWLGNVQVHIIPIIKVLLQCSQIQHTTTTNIAIKKKKACQVI